jgi:acyl-CoA hydrolase
VPIFLSDIPPLFLRRQVPLDAALLQLSPPDAHGYCTLGTSVDAALAASLSARVLVAEINDRMPRTLGNTLVPFSRIASFVHTSRPLHEHTPRPPTDVENAIGEHVAALVEDGSTLQMGIGAIPDAALRRLAGKHDLGVHTEMFSDDIVDLVEAGAITNRRKQVHPGRIVTSFVLGSERLYRFVHDNAAVEFHPCDRTNDTALIRKNRASSRSIRRWRSTSRARWWPTRSASGSIRASAGRWTSSAARRCRPAASRSSRCRPPRPAAGRRASCRRCSRGRAW